jgi:RNA polymerase sigma-70 factor (ECF subfamily)
MQSSLRFPFSDLGTTYLCDGFTALVCLHWGRVNWDICSKLGAEATFQHIGTSQVSLSEVDRQLLQRCLDSAPRAWQDFVDRFLGLVVHVANHAAEARGLTLDEATRDDLVAEVFLTLVVNDFGVLRRFRRNCSLATYLTVVARRVIVRRLWRTERAGNLSRGLEPISREAPARIENQEEVQKLLLRLDPKEANVVRMYHLEGKSYEEISRVIGMSENSIGPVLSRARDKMRNGSDQA